MKKNNKPINISIIITLTLAFIGGAINVYGRISTLEADSKATKEQVGDMGKRVDAGMDKIEKKVDVGMNRIEDKFDARMMRMEDRFEKFFMLNEKSKK